MKGVEGRAGEDGADDAGYEEAQEYEENDASRMNVMISGDW